MNDIVEIVNNQVVVSSRQIADSFEKEHKNVLSAVREILTAENSAAKFFVESSFTARGKTFPEYLMNRDGFSLLVMGFTGQKALEWKLKYIEAFNRMESALRERLTPRRPLCYEAGRVEAAFLVAEKLAGTFKVSKERATASALATIQKDIGLPSENFRALIPAIPVNLAALMNPTEVGKRLDPVLPPKKVNQLLADLGFQERIEKGWKLTEAGADHGENRPYERNNHSGLQIQWRDSIVPILQHVIEEDAA